MKALSRTAQVYIVCISLLGVVGLLWPQAEPLTDLWGFVLFFVLCGLAQLMPVQLFQETSVSVSGAIALAGMLVFGPFYAAWINVAFGVVHYLTMVRPRRHPVYRSMVTTASVVLAVRLGGVVYGILTGLLPLANPVWALLTILGVGFVYFAVNTFTVSLAMALEKGQPITSIWRINYNWLTPNYLALMALAWGIARVYTSLGIPGLLVFLIPLAMAYYSFKLYMGSTKEVRQRNEELEKANERLNIMQQVSRSFLASLDPEETLDLIIKALTERMGFPVSFIMLVEDGRYQIVRSYGTGSDLRAIREQVVNDIWPRLQLDSGPYVARAETHPRLIEACRSENSPIVALYFLPLIADGRVSGVIGAASEAPWDEAQQKEFFIFAAQASTALERAKAHERARLEAILDPLTGLYNHRYFQESIRQLIGEVDLRGGYLSLLMIDINDFKQFNDTYGHVAGDQALSLVARLLRQNVRQQDIVCRYGGDEMTVLLVNADKAKAIEIGERIYQVVQSYPFQVRLQKKGLSRFDISVSIGISTYPEITDSREALIEGADDACYRAKRLRGGVAYHVPVRDAASRARTKVSIVK